MELQKVAVQEDVVVSSRSSAMMQPCEDLDLSDYVDTSLSEEGNFRNLNRRSSGSWLSSLRGKRQEDDGIELLNNNETKVNEVFQTTRPRRSFKRRPSPQVNIVPKPSLPKSAFFIIGSEFCERFTYYGMKTILALFFVHRLGMDEREATEAMAWFAVASYATPVFGAYISDALIGRYKTITRLSAVYLVGTVVMSIAAALSNAILVLIALSLVAMGTGGIKPNVSAFGGDQINPPEPVALQRFFSFFYAAINAGSLLSSIATPVVRMLFGYSIAFALPAVLMFIALVALVSGRRNYRHVPPQGDLTTASMGVITRGARSWWSGDYPLATCLNGAVDKYGLDFVNDVRRLGNVLLLFLPAPLFWSLFDQQSSRWTFQATRMNSRVGGIDVPPEMVQSLNAVLILILIPLFDRIFYPTVAALFGPKVATHAVHRMAAGMILASVSFGFAAAVQVQIETKESDYFSMYNTTDTSSSEHPPRPSLESSQISVLWLIPQYVVMTAGEILFSVTGLEFAFREAPDSMKSVVTSGWLLTTAMGNLLTVVFLELLTKNMDQVQEFYAFAFGCLVAMLFLLYLYHCYQRGVWVDKREEDVEARGGQKRSSSGGLKQTSSSPKPRTDQSDSPSSLNMPPWSPSVAFNQAAGYGVVEELDSTSVGIGSIVNTRSLTGVDDREDAYHDTSTQHNLEYSDDEFQDCGDEAMTDSPTRSNPTLQTSHVHRNKTTHVRPPVVVDIL